MSKSVNLNLKFDEELIEKAEKVFSRNGLKAVDVFNLVMKYSVVADEIPVELLDIPNAETIAAMKEADALSKDPNAKRYHSVEELFEELDRDEV